MDFLKKLLLAAAVLCIVGTAAPAMAIDQAETDSYAENVTRKLGRGIINAGFGALELPLKVYKVNFEEGGLAACTYGVLYGVYEVVKREIVGVVEIATFLGPLPGCMPDEREAGWGYGPILRPEWIITPETNAYNVVYPNSAMLN